MLDIEGGWESFQEKEERTEHDEFTYVWDQEEFDAITHLARCTISFEFEDESELKRAFIYNWRIWTLPEVREVLIEAGFSRADVYMEGWDPEEEEGDGIFTRTESEENCESWISYIVGVK